MENRLNAICLNHIYSYFVSGTPAKSEDFGHDPVELISATNRVALARDGDTYVLNELTLPDLKQTAKARGLTFGSTIRKPQLFAFLVQQRCHSLSCYCSHIYCTLLYCILYKISFTVSTYIYILYIIYCIYIYIIFYLNYFCHKAILC